jgi:DNA-binding MarR family transcriptional regulator
MGLYVQVPAEGTEWTPTERVVWLVLAVEGRPLTPTEISRRTRCSPAAIRRAIDSLLDRGQLIRATGPDARTQPVALRNPPEDS